MKHLLTIAILFTASPVFAEGAIADAVVLIGGCSGVCVDPDGIILTAKHCDLPEVVDVTFPNRKPVKAHRIYVGPDAEDLLAFDADDSGWPSATVATELPKAGDAVWSAGYPATGPEHLRTFKLAKGKMTGGSEMTFGRDGIPVGKFKANTVDFVTGPGWSGGPLFNENGAVLGVLSAGNEDGSIYISWAATRRAMDAVVPRQFERKPHMYVFGMKNCGGCIAFNRDEAAGFFKDYDIEHVDIETPEGNKLFYDLIAALEKANPTFADRDTSLDGVPAFHVAGRATMQFGYSPGRSGAQRLRSWLLETLRLPLTIPETVVGAITDGPGVSPLPPKWNPVPDPISTPPVEEDEPDRQPIETVPEKQEKQAEPEDNPVETPDETPSPLSGILTGAALYVLRYVAEKYEKRLVA